MRAWLGAIGALVCLTLGGGCDDSSPAGGSGDGGWFGPWTLTDATTNQSFQATMFDHPDGRSSATGGSRKEIDTYMLAWQSFFFKGRLNLFAGRRLDQFKSYLVAPGALVRGDRLTAGDRQGLYLPLARTTLKLAVRSRAFTRMRTK